MGHQQHRGPLLAELPQAGEQFVFGLEVQAIDRFVENENLRLVNEGTTEQQAPALSIGTFAKRAPLQMGQPELLELLKRLSALLARGLLRTS